jgi:hypothetical protein
MTDIANVGFMASPLDLDVVVLARGADRVKVA